MEFGWKPRDAEVGEVELWRLEEILQPAAQLAMEANPYTHHSSVSHSHPNWSLHKHETRVFLERIFRTKKNNRMCVQTSAQIIPKQTRLTPMMGLCHLLDRLPVDLPLGFPVEL